MTLNRSLLLKPGKLKARLFIKIAQSPVPNCSMSIRELRLSHTPADSWGAFPRRSRHNAFATPSCARDVGADCGPDSGELAAGADPSAGRFRFLPGQLLSWCEQHRVHYVIGLCGFSCCSACTRLGRDLPQQHRILRHAEELVAEAPGHRQSRAPG